MAEIEMSNRPDKGHYDITVDGRHQGLAAYRIDAERVVFTHTEVEQDGHGYGGRLVGYALDDVRARGLRAVPLCPFVAAFIGKHPEYADLVASSD